LDVADRNGIGGSAEEAAVLARLSRLDRFLPLWIALAMAAGLGLGTLVPGLNDGLDKLRIGTVSLPIAAGLLLMMYPVLAKVRYEDLGRKQVDGVSNTRFFGVSLLLSWLVGPALMFALAWIFLADQPAYRTGVIIVGLARCIAMVLVWNDIAQGDRERAAVLVVFNALFQLVAYSLLGYFYLTLLPGWLGLDTQGFEVGIWEVARTVLIFLGIPLIAGYLTRRVEIKRRGRDWYEQRFIPTIAPITLYGLLFTIVLLFAIQGDQITGEPLDVAQIALPLLVYFALMWVMGFASGRLMGFPYSQTASLSFTVASNDFELAIAVAVGVFGATSGQALAGVVGPLIEVPVLVGLVYLALWLRHRLAWPAPAGPALEPASVRGVTVGEPAFERPAVAASDSDRVLEEE
jgi:ACR3 family arsenite transporter